jgi:hypothetical protein
MADGAIVCAACGRHQQPFAQRFLTPILGVDLVAAIGVLFLSIRCQQTKNRRAEKCATLRQEETDADVPHIHLDACPDVSPDPHTPGGRIVP